MLRRSTFSALLAAGLLVSAAPLSAQASDNGRTPVPPEDWGKWERLGVGTLSPDGSWLAVPVSRVEEDGELRVRPTDDPDSVVIAPNGVRPTFSADGRWLAWSVGVGEDERERLEERDEPVRNGLGLLDLRTGDTTSVEAVASFAFSPDGRYLAMRRYPPEGRRDARGVDLVVRDLEDGTDTNFGNVAEYAWRDGEPLLAMVMDAEGMAGNGVQLFDASTRRLVTLDSEPTRYSGLEWREDAGDLALLRQVSPDGEDEDAWADTTHVVLAFTGLGTAEASEPHILDPSTAAGFPEAHRIVPWNDPRWSEDGRTVFVGVKERVPGEAECEAPEESGEEEGEPDEPEEEPEEDEPVEEGEEDEDEGEGCEGDDEEDDPTVEIWHARDVDIVPTQKVRANQNRRESRLSAWHVRDGRFVQLESEDLETVRVVDGAERAVGLDGTPYEMERMFGPVYRDVYLVDLDSGERTKVLDRIQYFSGMSPGGRYLLWLEDDQYWTWDVETGERREVTADVPTSFVDLEDDHTVEQKPPHGTAGWLEVDEAFLAYDKHDVWRLAPDGSDARRLTSGADDNVRHRVVRLDFDEDFIDPDRARYFSLYDDWTETWGYGRADRLGDEVERLVWEEARVGFLQKADSADVFAYRIEDFEDSPDYFVARGPRLDGAVQMTRTNPFQDDYLWGHSELVEFTNQWGDELQGSLYYPAGYEPGRQYPMIVYIYEIVSSAVRSYRVPSERSYYNHQGWVQDGYFVFQPDIVYRDRDPGVSAVASLEPAVQAVVETGMVDPDRVGLIGHSWGGYQTTFAVTQTDVFSAGVAGAPLTNLFSMYLSVYWNSGGTDARIFEISQGRMEVPFWEDEDSYRRNSPVFHIENMNTPLLMAQGTEDGAVDFNQGVEFYNAARRAGKDFVFLVYNDENHGFSREPNQRDYHRRIMEWFGHYLKGEPAPEWIEEGVPYLEQPGGRRSSGGGR